MAGAIVVKWEIPSKYWVMHLIGVTGCQSKEKEEARDFLIQLVPKLAAGEESDKEITARLWQVYGSESPHPQAEVCLRCVISHYLKNYCYKLVEQYGSSNNFTAEDLFPLVLDITGSSLGNGNNNSITCKILETFDIEKNSSLSTWSKILARSDKEVKRFLLERGIEQISDWLILKQYSPRRLGRILSEFYCYSSTQIEQLTKLLETYQEVYLAARNQKNRERQQQGLRKLTTPYPIPNHQQLQQMTEQLLPIWKLPTNKVLEELQNLAQLLREYRINPPIPPNPPQKNSIPDNKGETNEFLTAFKQQYDSCFRQAVQQVIEDRVRFYQRRKKPKHQQFLKALKLYHCQVVSMGDIAPQIDLPNQCQVSRLLEQKDIRADVARKTVSCLVMEVFKIIPEELSLEKQNELREKLTPILYEQVNAEMEKAEKQDYVSRNRTMNNKLSRTICQYLDEKY